MSDYQLCLDVLLEMHGTEINREDGYSYRIQAWTVPPTKAIPHGIRYSLTLHDKYNKRIMGFDNAHVVKPPKKGRFSGKRVLYDHLHRTSIDKGIPYDFESPAKLIEDFFNKIDEVILEREKK